MTTVLMARPVANRGGVIVRGRDHAGFNRVGEIRQLNVGERGDQTAAIMQIPDDHFRAERGERVGALAERSGQDSNWSAFFAEATRDVRTGGSMTPGGTGHQDRCGDPLIETLLGCLRRRRRPMDSSNHHY